MTILSLKPGRRSVRALIMWLATAMGGSPYRGGTLAANATVDDRNYDPEKVRRKVAMELRSACHLVREPRQKVVRGVFADVATLPH